MKIADIIDFNKLKELLNELEESKLLKKREKENIYNDIKRGFLQIRDIKNKMF